MSSLKPALFMAVSMSKANKVEVCKIIEEGTKSKTKEYGKIFI